MDYQSSVNRETLWRAVDHGRIVQVFCNKAGSICCTLNKKRAMNDYFLKISLLNFLDNIQANKTSLI